MTRGRLRDGYVWAVVGVLVTYVGTRAVVWSRIPNLDGHDSVSYLIQAFRIRSEGLTAFSSFTPDDTSFLPFFSALLSLAGGSVETGARLFSFVASLLLLVAFWGIGRLITDRIAIVYGALLLALHPFLIRLSPAVLTEPSYIATVYLGLWLFLKQSEQPTPLKGAVLGAVFGLAFLNRVEGILFLGFIPVLQLAHWFVARDRGYGLGRLSIWCIIFITIFSAFAAPQVWRVSQAMERFSLNGRQTWSMIFMQENGRSEEEKIYGLDYSDSVINLRYLQTNPSAAAGLGRPVPDTYLRLVVNNFDDLYQNRLGQLIGPLALGAFLLGLLSLLQARQFYYVIAVSSFIAVGVMGPLLHTVIPRHIAIIVPIIMLVAGIGVRDVVRQIQVLLSGSSRRWVPVGVVLLLFAPIVNPLRLTVSAIQNNEYDPAALVAPARVLQATAAREGLDPPRVAARKFYLAYESGAMAEYLPETDLEGLIRYLEANAVDFLFVDTFYLERRRFGKHFTGELPLPSEFELLHEDTDRFGRRIMLYRFLARPKLETEPPDGERVRGATAF